MTTQPFMSPTPGPRSQSPSRVTGQPSAHTVSAWPSRSSVGPAPSSRRAVELVAGARDLEPPRREQLAEPVRDRVDAGDVVGARIDRREPLDLLQHRRELTGELPAQFARPYHPAR